MAINYKSVPAIGPTKALITEHIDGLLHMPQKMEPSYLGPISMVMLTFPFPSLLESLSSSCISFTFL